MTLLTGAVVTLVIWAVSLVRSVRLRALIYSLPLPITLVLVTTRIPVGAQQLLGVVLLNLFVATVAWLHHRLRWHILLADLAGIAAYIAGSWTLLQAGRLPFAPILATTLAAWVIVAALHQWTTTRRQQAATHRQAQTPPGRRALPTVGKIVILALGALLMVGLGQLLQGMVVTFPYSGVLVVIETRRDLVEFRAHFTRNSLALLAFITAYYLSQDISRHLAVTAGWAAFLLCALLLHLTMKTKDHSQTLASTHSWPTAPSRPSPSRRPYNCSRQDPTTPPLTRPTTGSDVDPSSAGSSPSTNEPHSSPGHPPGQGFGTAQEIQRSPERARVTRTRGDSREAGQP
ncbi:hypothetical protein ACNTMW_26105 [Planosporangium sp. 12N6]|uniref:hypothetical protein n=1 Tax=Planosporangium spinosum TaxID=3402278 RepID=UPI003CF5B42D